MERIYRSLFYRQRADAPLQVAFVAPSSEIAAWSRVPTKKTANIRNFQRAEIPQHVKEVSKFFSDSHNSSPTAVVVGFDPSRSLGRVSLLGEDATSPFDEAAMEPGSPAEGFFRVEWSDAGEPETRDEMIASIVSFRGNLERILYGELEEVTHLAPEILQRLSAGIEAALSSGRDRDLEALDEDSEEDEDFSLSPDDLSENLRGLLAGLSPSECQVAIGRLALIARTRDSLLRRPNLQLEDLSRLVREVSDECKPGLLIDGQHRVHGTKRIGRIPFLVTAIPHAAWPELAFQFIVTNRTARKVPESLLISIVGNSLSREQRGNIEERLREAGIRVGLIEAVMRVHEDETSPFYRMLAFGVKPEAGFIDAAAMRGKVIHLWFERKKPIDILFDHFCQGKKKGDRTEYWKDEELWFVFFVEFWNAVKSRYVGSSVFSDELDADGKPISKLMTATVLKIFQDTTLDYLERYLRDKQSTEGIPLSTSLPTAERFGDLVRNALTPLTPDFFTEWSLTGFDGSKGAREDLSDAILKVLKREKTVAQLKSPNRTHRLFKSQTG